MTETTFHGLTSGQLCTGRYRIGAPLAQGGMGQLFHAVRVRDGRRVVLKCQGGGGPPDRAQLRAEAAALGALAHSSIVRLVEFEESDATCFLAMESLEGDDLGERMRREALPVRVALRFLEELASALDHMHARGVVHRDVKPANVMLARCGSFERAVLVDFGLATSATGPRSAGRYLCGTPAYMAPEQALGVERAIGPATDRYALATIALELLTGRRPYPSLPVSELIAAIVETPPRRPSQLGDFDATVDAVFARAMARDPARRHGSALDMVRAIQAVVPARNRRCGHAGWQAAPTLEAAVA